MPPDRKNVTVSLHKNLRDAIAEMAVACGHTRHHTMVKILVDAANAYLDAKHKAQTQKEDNQ